MSRHKADWDKLFDLLDNYEFDIEDFLAVICSTLSRNKENDFKTQLAVADYKFNIDIKKEPFCIMEQLNAGKDIQ